MSVLLSLVCALSIFAAFYKLYRFVVFVRLLDGVPRIKESFPFSLPIDMLLLIGASGKRNKERVRTVQTLPKSKLYPRLLFKILDKVMPDYYDQPIVCCFYGPLAIAHAMTPESAEAILGHPKHIHKNFSHHFLKPWLGNGLFSHPGNHVWKNHRRMLTPALHFRILDDYLITMNEAALRIIDELLLTNNNAVDVLPIMRLCTFAILFETAMGIKLNKDDAQHLQFLEDCDELADLIQARFVNLMHWPDVLYRFTEGSRKTQKASQRISHYIYEVIDKKLSEACDHTNDDRQSFIDIVLKMHNEGLLSREDVRDQVATFIVGGFDTTATTLSFALHLLARDIDVTTKLQREVESVIGQTKIVTKDHLKNMPYLDAVCKESLRLFPPLPLIARNVSSLVRVGKHQIPPGTLGLVHVYHLHRNPFVWERPNDFAPERFLDDIKRHPFSFVPFSAGPRNCIGQKFANQEDKILLAHMVRAFNLESLQETSQIRLSMELILRPLDGLFVRFEPRT